MKYAKSFVLAAGLFAVCGIMPIASATAHANSAPPYCEGTDGSGIVFSGGQCPVEVERETLIFNIPQFPSHYADREQLLEYHSEVTAKYTFYNPTDMEVNMKLLFPFGAAPVYVEEGAEDISRYRITADGAPVDYTLRYTFAEEGGGSFDIDEGMGQLSEDFRSDGFFKPDTPVAVHRYEVNAAPEEGAPYLEMVLELNPEKTRVIGNVSSSRVENGRLAVRLYAESTFGGNGGIYEYCFWTAGELPAVHAVNAVRGAEVIEGAEITQGKKEDQGQKTNTFKDFILALRRENLQISETDWYNAALDWMYYYGSNSKRRGEDCVFLYPGLAERQLMRWYEYELTVSAGGRMTNEVTAPLYPNIDGSKNAVYRYNYYLSPARKWADFKAIEIMIETPYNLTESSLEFTRKEGVYNFSRSSLPLGDLTFTLYNGDNPNPSYGGEGWDALFTALKIAGIIVVACGIGIVIFFAVRKNRSRRGEVKKEDKERKN